MRGSVKRYPPARYAALATLLFVFRGSTAVAHRVPGHEDADAPSFHLRIEALRRTQLAQAPDLSPEDLELLKELENALANQQRELDQQLATLAQANDSATKVTLQEHIASLRQDIDELTRLRGELQSPLSGSASVPSAAQTAAAVAGRRLEQDQQRTELLEDQRSATRYTPR